ncbi:MAG: D-alanyl-D-alanine carboxypeptidase family protein [Hyphomicrobiales bacterium]
MRVPTGGRRGRSVAVFLALVALVFAALLPQSASAGPTLVFDLQSGEVKSAENALQPWYPASVTKIMTAYVTFRALREGRLKLNSPVIVSQNAASQAPSKMGFKPGTVLTVDNALKMMIVKSANDIAMALGETVGGSEAGFVAEMNSVARSIGMTQTVWANPNGLPNDAAHTTARDLGILTRAALTEFPEYSGIFSISAIKHGKRVLRSHNLLLDRYPGTIGMKTGFICASGFNLVAVSKRSGRTLVAVVLGARSGLERAAIAKKILDDGFSSRSLFGGGRGPSIDSLGADQAAAGPTTCARPCAARTGNARASRNSSRMTARR